MPGIIYNTPMNIKTSGKTKLGFYSSYTLLWILMCVFIFIKFIIDKTTNIWVVDGMSQHLTALTYYSKYMRETLGNIFSGNFHIKEWDMSIGEGSDVFNTLNYYCFGDPFALLSILFPAQYMYVCYVILSFARCYLAGIAFDLFFRKLKPNAVLLSRISAALMYAFSFWTIYNIIKHPFFLNPLIFMPLILLGVEKIINREKPYLFTVAVTLSALSNVYFFYIMVILTVIYTVVRLLFSYRDDIKNMFKTAGIITLFSVIGVLMAAVVFYPAAINLMGDSRLADGAGIKLFYPLSYYKNYLEAITYAGEYYLCFGFTVPAVIASGLIWTKKGKAELKIFTVLMLLFSLIPLFGQMFNGFSYITNRWSFAAALIISTTLGLMWEDLLSLTKKQVGVILSGLGIYMLLYIILKKPVEIIVPVVVLLGIIFAVLVLYKKKQAAVAVVMVSIVAPWFYYICGFGFSNRPIPAPTYFPELYYNHTEAAVIKNHRNSNEFQRYSGWVLTDNTGLYNDMSSTQYYWSNNNPYVMKFRSDVGIDEYRLFYYSGYDSDASLLALSSVGTYAKMGDSQPLPYGFNKAYEENDYEFYESDNNLPVAYTYDRKMSINQWEKLSMVERRQALLETAVVPGEFVSESPESKDVTRAEYKIIDKRDVEISENRIVATKEHAYIVIGFEGVNNSEMFFSVKNLDYSSDSVEPEFVSFAALINGSEVLKYFTFYNEGLNWYNGRRDFAINTGYRQEPYTEVKIYIPTPGTYTFDDFAVEFKSMENFETNINNLRSEDIRDVLISEDKVSMTANLSSDKFMVFSIPYAEGWSLSVDGNETELTNANGQYMGADISAGDHKIELTYHNPNLNTGWMISILGMVMFGLAILGYNKFTNPNGEKK